MRIAINGFGRIGRLVLRRIAELGGVEVAAINDLADPSALAYLFRYDSVHGRVENAALTDGCLEFAGQTIPLLSERNPEDLQWGDRGVDVVIDATGVFLKRAMASRHLDSGAGRVVITAPAVDPDRTVVMGVNEDSLDLDSDRLISNASCTTNCIGPVSRVLNEAFGIQRSAL